MTKLYQPAATIANFRKAIISFWFRIPASYSSQFNSGGTFVTPGQPGKPFGWYGGCELLTFGVVAQTTVSPFNKRYCSVNLCLGDFPMAMDWVFGDNPNVHYKVGGFPSTWNIAAWFSCDPGDGSTYDGFNNPYVCDYDSIGQAVQWDSGFTLFGHLAYLPPFSFDEWHHCVIAADLSAADTFGNFPIVAFGTHVTEVTSILVRARKIEIYVDGARVHGIYMTTADTKNSNPINVNWNIPPSSPPIDVLVNGYPLSLPTFVTALDSVPAHGVVDITYNPQIEYANMQVWFGVTTDLSVQSNLDTFVLLDGSGNPILPPDIRAAQDAFGASDIWLNRDSISDIKFEENQGTAGPFTVVGTVPVDFRPLPGEP